MRKLILHAGIHRTGTTSIQRYLSRNRKHLAAQAISYPGTTDNQQEFAFKLMRRSITPDAFADMLSESEHETILVSGEDFCRIADESIISALAKRFRIHLILFIRRQDEWAESWYNQHIKWPFNKAVSVMSPLEFIGTLPDYNWLYYDVLITRWSKYVETIDVPIFDEVEDSVAEFCRLAGIVQAALSPLDENANSSLSAVDLEIVRHLGMAQLSPQMRLRILKTLREAKLGSPNSGPIFPASVKRLILERFEESNRASAKILGRSPVLFKPVDDYPYVASTLPDSYTLMRQFVAPLLAKLNR
jgi:hypothetical protein